MGEFDNFVLCNFHANKMNHQLLTVTVPVFLRITRNLVLKRIKMCDSTFKVRKIVKNERQLCTFAYSVIGYFLMKTRA